MNNIDTYRLKTMLSALKLETLGMKRRGQSVYSLVKKEFNLKGNKKKVHDDFKIIVQNYKSKL